jgi:hypothetical protein
MKALTTLILLFFIQLTFGQTTALFTIVQHDSIGYINDKGKVVIRPIYLNGSNFSEGLAAVRPNGRYGYIDTLGNFVLQPQFDMAYSFKNGLALVYKNGQPMIIDIKGNIAFPSAYKAIRFINDRKGVVTTLANKQGIIDISSKELLADTVFDLIGDFNYGVAMVRQYNSPKKKHVFEREAVIDTNGNFVVPFDKYVSIKPFSEGYALVEIDDHRKKGYTDGAIDTKGNLLFKRPYDGSIIDEAFHDGYVKAILYKKEGDNSEKSYGGFINLKGELAFSDTNFSNVTDFSNGRAFIRLENYDHLLIDRNFKQVGKDAFRITTETFTNGYAVAKTNDGTGIIDTLGNFVISPQYKKIDLTGIANGYFYFTNDDSDTALFGISNLKGKVIIPPVMQQYDRNGFANGLIKAIINNKLTCINTNGDIVWHEEEDTTRLKLLNIDFMNRGYFYAYSTPKHTEANDSGGWAVSSNRPHKITESRFPDKLLALIIDTALIDTFAKRYTGYKIFISNTTGDTIQFDAQDSRLYMNLQAQNKRGEWKDIEYLPSSWCGNSYHTLQLETNAYWQFTIPAYHGELQTKVRAKLTCIDQANPKKKKEVYSNVINGGINPGQFWNKIPYNPINIMDPYFD